MLPKQKRITKDSFKSILLKGALYHADYFTLRTIPSEKEGFAVSVSKKVAKGAVDRNRIRRRAYSVIRSLLHQIKSNSMSILSAKSNAKDISFGSTREDIEKLLKKARLI